MIILMPELFFIAIIVILTILYLLERNRADHLEQNNLDQSQQKGWNIIHRAMQKAQNIVGTAEIEELKLTAESQMHTKQVEKALEEQFKKQFQESAANLESSFKTYLNQLQTQSSQNESQLLESSKQRVNQMLSTLEQNLTEFLNQTSQKSTTSIELEIRSARQLIDSYKRQQLVLVDENIVAIIERTLSLILPKKISLNDQIELVYEALEKAKIEKFII